MIVFELETAVYREPELQALVDTAKTWQFFAADDTMVFRNAGHETKIERWRGPPSSWTPLCGICGSDFAAGIMGRDCSLCPEMHAAKKVGLGPELVIYSLKYRIMSKD